MKVELMKQNKNTLVVRVASAALAAFVLFFSLCVPSFAIENPSFDDQPIPNTGTSSYREDNYENSTFDVGHNTSGSINYRVFSSTNSHDVYAVGIGSSSPYAIYFLTDNTSSTQIAGIAGKYLSGAGYIGSSSQQTLQLSTIDSVTQFRYYPTGTSIDVVNVPVFSDIETACLGLQTYLDNAGGTPHPLTISVPCGQAIYVDITGLSGVSANVATSTNKYYSSPHSWNPTVAYTDSILTSGSIPGSPISWSGRGGTDVFGRYISWYSALIVQPNKKYIVICNPFMDSAYLDDQHESNNAPIVLSVSSALGYKFVALNASFSTGSGITNESTSDVLDGSYDDSTNTWVTTDQNGTPTEPKPGGANTANEGATINDWLQNIAHTISGFFTGAIGAVSTLVGAGSDFIQSLSSLYSWLPGPVYAVLSSALILVITIGVIKVFI